MKYQFIQLALLSILLGSSFAQVETCAQFGNLQTCVDTSNSCDWINGECHDEACTEKNYVLENRELVEPSSNLDNGIVYNSFEIDTPVSDLCFQGTLEVAKTNLDITNSATVNIDLEGGLLEFQIATTYEELNESCKKDGLLYTCNWVFKIWYANQISISWEIVQEIIFDHETDGVLQVSIATQQKQAVLETITIMVGSTLELVESDYTTSASGQLTLGDSIYVNQSIINTEYRDNFRLEFVSAHLTNANSEINLTPLSIALSSEDNSSGWYQFKGLLVGDFVLTVRSELIEINTGRRQLAESTITRESESEGSVTVIEIVNEDSSSDTVLIVVLVSVAAVALISLAGGIVFYKLRLASMKAQPQLPVSADASSMEVRGGQCVDQSQRAELYQA